MVILDDNNVQYFAAILAIVTAVLGAVLWGVGVWKRRLRIHRVTRSDDPILDTAFELYERRLDENVRDNPADFRRWLEENREARLAGNCNLTILFYIAEQNEEARAFFYAEYYRPVRLLLISYLVTHESRAGTRASNIIMRRLNWRLRLLGCRGLVFELEQPAPRDKGWVAKWYLFERLSKGRVRFMRLEVPYMQPKLSLWESDYTEEPQYLFYGRFNSPSHLTLIPRAEVAMLLDTVYNAWYAGSFEDEPERDREYRKYVAGLCDRIKSELPEWVPGQLHPRPWGLTKASSGRRKIGGYSEN